MPKSKELLGRNSLESLPRITSSFLTRKLEDAFEVSFVANHSIIYEGCLCAIWPQKSTILLILELPTSVIIIIDVVFHIKISTFPISFVFSVIFIIPTFRKVEAIVIIAIVFTIIVIRFVLTATKFSHHLAFIFLCLRLRFD